MYYAADNNVRLHVLVSHETYQQLEEWRAALNARREIKVHYPSGVPFAYAARIAILLGLEAIKSGSKPGNPQDLCTTEEPPRGFGLSCPMWLLDEVDALAAARRQVRSRTLRAIFHAGLSPEDEH